MMIMDFETHFDDIADLCGGRGALQELLGVGASALSNYIARGQLPRPKLAKLSAALAAKGYELDWQSLAIRPHSHTASQPICLLIITGGIAAYKSLELARRLMDEGYRVRGVMTKSAQEFITPLSLSALTGEKVYTELFSLTDEQEMGHIRLAREADLVLIAPATSNFIAKIALGLADDLASTLCLASDAPLYFVPAMNPVMWAHAATQTHCATLRNRGGVQIGPDSGDTACGEIGTGRMAETKTILQTIAETRAAQTQNREALSGKHILITAGPTEEPIDGVRFISNRSSGKQGYAIAKACVAAGAKVTLISGPTALTPPENCTLINVKTAKDMHQASHEALPADVAICTAAVADWHVVGARHQKLKKQADNQPPILELAENPDILKSLCQSDNRPSLVIGFAAETDNPIEAARAKRATKNCDWLLVNHITPSAPVFGADENQLTCLKAGLATDDICPWPAATKEALGKRLADEIAAFFQIDILQKTTNKVTS